MRQRFVILGLFIAAVSSLGGMWMQSEIVMAAPQESRIDQTPQAICDGTSDIRAFLHSLGFTNDFRVMATLRDEAFSRRYYHVRVMPGMVPALRDRLTTAWVDGHFNRAVYENGATARVKRSRNLPAWWNLADPPAADHIMLDHAGSANWYVVLTDSGDTCFMWVGH